MAPPIEACCAVDAVSCEVRHVTKLLAAATWYNHCWDERVTACTLGVYQLSCFSLRLYRGALPWAPGGKRNSYVAKHSSRVCPRRMFPRSEAAPSMQSRGF